MQKLKQMINSKAREKFINLIEVYCCELGKPNPTNLYDLSLEELQDLELEISREIL